MTEDFALTLLRVTMGLLFAGHGAQMLFGWFNGDGIEGTTTNFAKMWVREPRLAAYGAGLAQLGGGALLALGLLTPIACAAILAVMLGAILLAHWPRFWAQEGGMEYPLVNVAILTMFGLIGPGGWSLDEVFGTAEALENPATYVVGACIAIAAVAGAYATRAASNERWQRPADDRFASQGR